MAVFITLIGKNTRWFYTSALSFSLPDYFQMLKIICGKGYCFSPGFLSTLCLAAIIDKVPFM
ncbi:hypothetical protein DLC09_01100 [Salmonella enterica subsp. enterica serovar Montevideo]|nr:hypothetical protein [Salmonella enterica subsp. enterica serovar Montevideo]EAQ6409392.1 hypothetical protein [Salmonella enterica]EBS5220347.1 hypothetical protein [Salmonella enterica subsp. enterica serovar Montevideo]EBU7903814.1 hypothetical protein [Salmonella enterica subsp. enterica serovar Montevideo]EBW5082671.1 hypothetical protein [Salmonella enterica subsp. enterica serovar Montevideo]